MTIFNICLYTCLCLGGETPNEIPPHLVEPFRILNEGRTKAGLQPFKWHNKLYQSAQELAEWGWDNYINNKANITENPHYQFLERLEKAGWSEDGYTPSLTPGNGHIAASECGIPGTSDSRGEDGKNYPRDPSGWCHPFMSPETLAKNIVHDLTIGITDPNEKHRWDYHANWTYAVLGYKGGIMIVDYGWLPEQSQPEPNDVQLEYFKLIGD